MDLWPFSSEGLSRLLGGGPKLAPVIRPAKVVPVSMADGESAEPLLEGSAMSREHPRAARSCRSVRGSGGRAKGERDG